VLNSMTPFDAILGGKTAKLIANPEVLEFSIKLARETARVGTTLGYRLEPILGLTEEDFLGLTDEVFKKLLLTLLSDTGAKTKSRRAGSHAKQDILKGRRTELEYINGLVVKKGQEARVPTPLNEAVTSIAKRIEQGTLKPDISNLKILEQYA